jgi:hypothetical protein
LTHLFFAKGKRIVAFLKMYLSKNNVKYIFKSYRIKFTPVAYVYKCNSTSSSD